MDRRQALRDLLIGLSLANLCLLRVWAELLAPGERKAYFLDPHPSAPIAAIVGVTLLGAALAGIVMLLQRVGKGRYLALAQWAFLLVLVILVGKIRTEVDVLRLATFAASVRETAGQPLPYKELGPLIVIVPIVLWRRRAVQASATVLLALSPFVLVTFGAALWAWGTRAAQPPAPAPDRRGPGPASPGSSSGRVVVLLFDELDYRAAFEARPAELQLPELDRLRREGLFASRALPLSSQTAVSVPALLTGQRVIGARAVGPGELLLTVAGDSLARGWSASPHLFARARELGARTAALGWYHPYCRLFGATLTECHWEPYYDAISRSAGRGFLATVREQIASLSPWAKKQRQLASYRRLLAHATRVAGDSTLDLVLIHWPIPHHPFIYDREAGQLTLHQYGPSGYVDQLALVDRTVGALRREMERTGVWASTAVLVTSDHAARRPAAADGRADARVPFLLKPPDPASGPAGLAFDRRFSTLVLRDLTLALLAGELSTARDVVRWLRSRPPRNPSLR